MSKPSEDARTRLQAAALDLFAREGFEQVTAAQIAAHAGVTERTFFRYFPDKREVLFDGEALVRATLVEAIGCAPERLSPIEVLHWAFREFAPALEAKRAYAKPRQDLIMATPALHERELSKLDALSTSLADALSSRGVERRGAVLSARIGLAAFVQASQIWMDAPADGLAAHIETAFAELKTLLASTS